MMRAVDGITIDKCILINQCRIIDVVQYEVKVTVIIQIRKGRAGRIGRPVQPPFNCFVFKDKMACIAENDIGFLYISLFVQFRL
jgi:hypothetical protein